MYLTTLTLRITGQALSHEVINNANINTDGLMGEAGIPSRYVFNLLFPCGYAQWQSIASKEMACSVMQCVLCPGTVVKSYF